MPRLVQPEEAVDKELWRAQERLGESAELISQSLTLALRGTGAVGEVTLKLRIRIFKRSSAQKIASGAHAITLNTDTPDVETTSHHHGS